MDDGAKKYKSWWLTGSMKPQIVEHDDGFDIDVTDEAWVVSTVSSDGKTHISFRNSRGKKHPLTVKDIAGLGAL